MSNVNKWTTRWVFIFLLVSFPLFPGSLSSQGPALVSDEQESSRYDLVLEHASTNMQLARVELQYALEENRKYSGNIPEMAIERLRSNLAVAKQQYEEATLASIGGPERVRLRHAEEKLRLAKLSLEQGRKKVARSSISELEWRRLELKYDLARLHLALINNPEEISSMLYRLEVKLNHLGEEILSLDQRITKLEPLR
ncbi:hypothetical protein CA13_65920 [Planctomycetes bacterium CA13]|uniref:DUF4398 domain-containing protein n=1 Tax=Novipirellula herctigrandis TaxID=2527986 RepID=A0A5C5ZD76_9BACT|nr:hypothetical protein CA13_65920 [Planctomycetes bacterium CA13]